MYFRIGFLKHLSWNPKLSYKPVPALNPSCLKNDQTQSNKKSMQKKPVTPSCSSLPLFQLLPVSDCSYMRHPKLKPFSQVFPECQIHGKCKLYHNNFCFKLLYFKVCHTAYDGYLSGQREWFQSINCLFILWKKKILPFCWLHKCFWHRCIS